MSEKKESVSSEAEGNKHQLKLPKFLVDEEIGLGDAVKKITYAIGFKQPCGGCERRAEALNRWMKLTPR